VGWLGEVALDRPAMGFGDITLMAVIGGAVGPNRALLTLFLGATIAPIVLLGFVYPLGKRRRDQQDAQLGLDLKTPATWRGTELPFGVFLAPAGMVALVYGDRIIAWYLRVSGLQ
jgi:prepilin signal peptidase PulO-like enzyme (type II secretory pathway)